MVWLNLLFLWLTSCAALAPQKTPTVLGNDLVKAGLYREAIDVYTKALSKEPENMALHRNLGIVLVKTGNYPKALKHLKKAIAKYENDFDSNFFLGEAYRAEETFGEAIFYYKKANKLNAKNLHVMKALAWAYYKTRFYSEALRISRLASEQDRKDVQTKIIQARIYLKLSKFKSAFDLMEQAKAKISSLDLAFIESVQAEIYQRIGQDKKAFILYQSALKKQPLLASAVLGLAKCHLANKNYKKSIEYLEQAVRLKPAMKEAYFNLGLAYEGINKEKSLKYFSLFRSKAGSDPDYLQDLVLAKQKIKELGGRVL